MDIQNGDSNKKESLENPVLQIEIPETSNILKKFLENIYKINDSLKPLSEFISKMNESLKPFFEKTFIKLIFINYAFDLLIF